MRRVLGLLADVLEHVRVGHDHLAELARRQAQRERLAARDDVALERAAREQRGLADQIAGAERRELLCRRGGTTKWPASTM